MYNYVFLKIYGKIISVPLSTVSKMEYCASEHPSSSIIVRESFVPSSPDFSEVLRASPTSGCQNPGQQLHSSCTTEHSGRMETAEDWRLLLGWGCALLRHYTRFFGDVCRCQCEGVRSQRSIAW